MPILMSGGLAGAGVFARDEDIVLAEDLQVVGERSRPASPAAPEGEGTEAVVAEAWGGGVGGDGVDAGAHADQSAARSTPADDDVERPVASSLERAHGVAAGVGELRERVQARITDPRVDGQPPVAVDVAVEDLHAVVPEARGEDHRQPPGRDERGVVAKLDEDPQVPGLRDLHFDVAVLVRARSVDAHSTIGEADRDTIHPDRGTRAFPPRLLNGAVLVEPLTGVEDLEPHGDDPATAGELFPELGRAAT
ncbi:MAG TPA: hypothetical protein RMI62_24450 [Polyangiaceae bacterium LLY-WYZ-15_(1-7)]|nr:hypothetical protein [Polyangiaceae bacterium LLY-WYZ-15_(1-7)]